MRIWTESNYMADADGNRGKEEIFYELENTKEEKQEIAELLYYDFTQNEKYNGSIEIEYQDLVIEVDIDNYHTELAEMVKKDIDLDIVTVNEIAMKLDDLDIIVDWSINQNKTSIESFILIAKYALNRLNQDKFNELMIRAIGEHLNDGYLNSKWEAFRMNELSFLTSYKELTKEIAKEIFNTGYKG